MSSVQVKNRTVKIRETVLGDGRPKIYVPVTARSMKELEEQLELIMQVQCDLVELRADYFDQHTLTESLEKILRLVREKIREKVLVFTFRTQPEGGERTISFEDYRSLNLRAADSEADLVDLELFTIQNTREKTALPDADTALPDADTALPDADTAWPDADAAWSNPDAPTPGAEPAFVREIHAKGCKVIGSSHDFEKTPETEEMVCRLVRMQELGMDITKLAVMPQTRGDVVRLLDATVRMRERFADRPFVTMAMGKLGVVTRCIVGFSGSAFTFAAAASASAPGQISADRMAAVLDLTDEIL